MKTREKALKAFNEHFAFKDNPIAWSAWKMAWDLAYNEGYDQAYRDKERFQHNQDYDYKN